MFYCFFRATTHARTTFSTVGDVPGKTLSALDHEDTARADVRTGTVPIALVVVYLDGFSFGFEFGTHKCHVKSLSLTRNQPRFNKNLPLGAHNELTNTGPR